MGSGGDGWGVAGEGVEGGWQGVCVIVVGVDWLMRIGWALHVVLWDEAGLCVNRELSFGQVVQRWGYGWG